MKRLLLLFSLVAFSSVSGTPPQWDHVSGPWKTDQHSAEPVRKPGSTFFLLRDKQADQDMAWDSLSVDFLFTSEAIGRHFGVALNVEDADDYRGIRISPQTSGAGVLLIQNMFSDIRQWGTVGRSVGLNTDRWYTLSVARNSPVNKENWRPWFVEIKDRQSGERLVGQYFDNVRSAFGWGYPGLFSSTTGVKFSNFDLKLQQSGNHDGVLRLAPLFCEGMVLQRYKPIEIWGRGQSGETVKVSLGGKSRQTQIGQDGHWRIEFDPFEAAVNLELVVESGPDRVIVRNVAVGEVWLAGGQSNMVMKMFQSDMRNKVDPGFHDPMLRVFTQPCWPSPYPVFSSGGRWNEATYEEMMGWSAIACRFAFELRRKLNVPVGIILAAWGGTTVESWMPRELLVSDPCTKPIVDRYEASVTASRAKKQLQLEAPYHWDVAFQHHAPGYLYDGMIAPLTRYALNGFIWYQGESSTPKAAQYAISFPLLIDAWRSAWNDSSLGFYYVQLAGYKGKDSGASIPDAWPQLRDIQRRTLSERGNTGMVVSMYMNPSTPENIHPRMKEVVGIRLANMALHDLYGFTDIVRDGPLLEGVEFKRNAAILTFSGTEAGLHFEDDTQTGFVVAGEDRVFYPAKATVEGDGKSIRVVSKQVPHPVAVRYRWENYPSGGALLNSEGLPASPFRTDNWPLATDGVF